MAVVGLVLCLTWLVIVIGVRMVIQARRTGDTGLRHQSHSRTELVGQLLLVASVLAGGVVAPIAGVAGLDPVGPLAGTGIRMAGVAVGVLGIVLTLVAQLEMGSSWRIGVDPGERTALVTGGLFRLTRNPIFSATILTAVGVAVAVGNVIALLGAVGLIAAFELHVRRVEEPYLRRTHGDEYAAYAAQVGRFVPGIGRMGMPV